MASRSKRGATTELNHDNWDRQEEDTPEDPGHFQTAKAEQLEKRVMKKAKRRTGATDSANGGSLFSGFGGFSKKPTVASTSTAEKISSFAAAPKPKINPWPTVNTTAPTPSIGDKLARSTAPPPSNGKSTSSTALIASSLSPAEQEVFAHRVSSLNRGVIDWAVKHIKEDNCVDLQPVFSDYSAHMKRLYAQFHLDDNTVAPSAVSSQMPDFHANLKELKYDFGAPNVGEGGKEKPIVFGASSTKSTTTTGGKKWPCPNCMVHNNDDVHKCPCCSAAKPGTSTASAKPTFGASAPAAKTTPLPPLFGQTAPKTAASPFAFGVQTPKPADKKWECSSCLVFNEASVDKCVACTTLRPGTTPSTTGTSFAAFTASQSSDKWECQSCFVRNDAKDAKCVACTTPNPKSKSTADASKPTPSVAPSPFSFGLPAAAKPSDDTPTSKPLFTFGLQKAADAPTSTFTFGLQKSTAETPVAAKPFSFAQTAPPATQSTDAEDAAYVPPKSDEVEHEEPDSLHSVKCKVYYMDDDAYIDRGVGMLHLKKGDDGKLQLIVRTTTATGQLLLNILLTPSMGVKRTGKNNLSFVCVPNPPIGKLEPKPTTMLLRVKTGEAADQLKTVIDENMQ